MLEHMYYTSDYRDSWKEGITQYEYNKSELSPTDGMIPGAYLLSDEHWRTDVQYLSYHIASTQIYPGRTKYS